MTWTIAGHLVQLDALRVEQRAAGHIPEAIRQHWVEVGGMRWPPKQVLELATGIPRSEFISHTALRILRDLGFSTRVADDGFAARPDPAHGSDQCVRARRGVGGRAP